MSPIEALFERARRGLRSVTAFFCGTLLLALTLVTVIDVIGRYLLSSPLPGADEYTELLLMGVIFCGLPAVCLDDGHIAVDVFTARLRGFWDAAQLMLARLFAALVLAVLAWQLWQHGMRLVGYRQVTVYLGVPLGPFALAAAVIVGACALATFAMAAARLAKGRGERV